MADYQYPIPPPPRRRSYEKPIYAKTWFWVVIVVVIAAIIIVPRMGLVKWGNAAQNATAQPTKELSIQEQLASYIVTQRAGGVPDTDIKQKLIISGYTEAQVNSGFELADPVVQYIIDEMSKNVTKPQIVEALLRQGLTPEQIQQKFAVVEKSKQVPIAEFIKKYWWLILLLGAAAYIWHMKQEADKLKKAPKVFTLEECREYAEELLKQKNLDFNPCKEYRNRTELRQYRFVYEEPTYPELNNHQPWGHKTGERQYYLIAISYGRELQDFRLHQRDTELREFLYAAAPVYEPRANTEYMRLRDKSELPIPDIASQEKALREREAELRGQQPEAMLGERRPYTPPNRRWWPRRYSPGPVEGET